MNTEPEKVEKLKPCPFCGGEAEVQSGRKGSSMVCAVCVECWTETDDCLTIDSAITAWNTRTTRPTAELLMECRDFAVRKGWHSKTEGYPFDACMCDCCETIRRIDAHLGSEGEKGQP